MKTLKPISAPCMPELTLLDFLNLNKLECLEIGVANVKHIPCLPSLRRLKIWFLCQSGNMNVAALLVPASLPELTFSEIGLEAGPTAQEVLNCFLQAPKLRRAKIQLHSSGSPPDTICIQYAKRTQVVVTKDD